MRRAVVGFDPGKLRDRAGLSVMWIDDHVLPYAEQVNGLFGGNDHAVNVLPFPGESAQSHATRVRQVEREEPGAIATALVENRRQQPIRRTGDIVHIELLPRGMSYPDMARRIVRELALPALQAPSGGSIVTLTTPFLVFDQGGVGEALSDIFREMRITHRRGIWSTTGDKPHFEKGTWYVSKYELVTTTQVAMQRDPPDLRCVESIPDVHALRAELNNYRVVESPSGRDIFGAQEDSRDDERRINDDLLSSIFVAWWFGSKKLELTVPTGADYASVVRPVARPD